MNPLRDKLFNLQKEEILKEFLGNNYLTTSQQEKDRVFGFVEQSVNQEVDNMLREFIDNYNVTSPQAKQTFWMQCLFTFINIVLTIGIAFAVNEENWVFVTILGIVSFASYFMPYIQNRK